MNVEQLSSTLQAIASPQRIQILTALSGGRLHISEVARRVGMSRPLLYMHAAKLEAAGFVTSNLELSDEGTALRYLSLQPFCLTIDLALLIEAVSMSDAQITTGDTTKRAVSGTASKATGDSDPEE